MRYAIAVLLIGVATLSQAQEPVPVGYIPQGKDLVKAYTPQTWAGAVIWTIGVFTCDYMYHTYPHDDRRNAGTLFLAGGVGGLAMVVGSRIPPLGKHDHTSAGRKRVALVLTASLPEPK
jgi:hypothetical protein